MALIAINNSRRGRSGRAAAARMGERDEMLTAGAALGL